MDPTTPAASPFTAPASGALAAPPGVPDFGPLAWLSPLHIVLLVVLAANLRWILLFFRLRHLPTTAAAIALEREGPLERSPVLRFLRPALESRTPAAGDDLASLLAQAGLLALPPEALRARQVARAGVGLAGASMAVVVLGPFGLDATAGLALIAVCTWLGSTMTLAEIRSRALLRRRRIYLGLYALCSRLANRVAARANLQLAVAEVAREALGHGREGGPLYELLQQATDMARYERFDDALREVARQSGVRAFADLCDALLRAQREGGGGPVVELLNRRGAAYRARVLRAMDQAAARAEIKAAALTGFLGGPAIALAAILPLFLGTLLREGQLPFWV